MNILDLHRDVFTVIGGYIVRNEDIFSFSLTCKRFQEQGCILERNVEIKLKDSSTLPLPQDFRRVKKFSWNSQLFLDDTKAQYLLQKMEQFTTLFNMKVFDLSDSKLSADAFLDTVSKMTWLEDIRINFMVPNTLGDLFDNHRRLTSLVVDGATQGDTPSNYEKLTQLKHLTVSASDGTAVMDQIQKLTGLTSLNISWTSISRESLKCLTKLTNLESLDVSGIDRTPVGSDWKFLVASLPKLRTLYDTPDDNESLLFLTNLRELTLEGEMIELNFAALTNLTRLCANCSDKTTQIIFPPNLKDLLLYNISNQQPRPAELFADLCNLTALESLELISPNVVTPNLQPLPLGITQLTRLRELKKFSLSPDLCHSLLKMPSLRNIQVVHLPQTECLEMLRQMTQLVEFCYEGTRSDPDIAQVRKNLPFAVYRT